MRNHDAGATAGGCNEDDSKRFASAIAFSSSQRTYSNLEEVRFPSRLHRVITYKLRRRFSRKGGKKLDIYTIYYKVGLPPIYALLTAQIDF